jgi:hypothetical protein
MATGISIVSPVMKGRLNDVWGARRVTLLTVNLGTSYTTGGQAFVPKQFGHQGGVSRVIISPRYAAGATGPLTRQFMWDPVNQKFVVIITSTGVEQANAGDVSGVVLDIIVVSD